MISERFYEYRFWNTPRGLKKTRLCIGSHLICSCSHCPCGIIGEVRDLEPWAMAWLGTTAPVYVLKYTEGFKNDTHKYLICVSELTISSTSKGWATILVGRTNVVVDSVIIFCQSRKTRIFTFLISLEKHLKFIISS